MLRPVCAPPQLEEAARFEAERGEELRKLHMMSSGVQGKSKEEVEERVAKMKADAEEKEEHTAVFREAFVRANGLKSMLSLLKSSSQKVLETLALVLKDLAGVVATRGLMVQQGALRIGIDLHARLPDKNVGKVTTRKSPRRCRPPSVVSRCINRWMQRTRSRRSA